MNKLKERFKEDPYFATVVVIAGVIALTKMVAVSAQAIESTAYARTTRMF